MAEHEGAAGQRDVGMCSALFGAVASVLQDIGGGPVERDPAGLGRGTDAAAGDDDDGADDVEPESGAPDKQR